MAGRFNSLQAVLFDLGSTLIYFDGVWPEVMRRGRTALQQALRDSGVECADDSFLQAFGERLDAYYSERETEFIEYTTAYVLGELLAERGCGDVAEDTLREALVAMYAVSQAHWKPDAEAQLVLAELQREGVQLGLISNAADDADVHALVDNAGFRPYFDVILTSAGEGIRKPNPRIFHTALARLGVTPEGSVMVGDTLGADILGAHNAGLRGVWLTRHADRAANRAHLNTIQPDAMIDHLGELPAALAQLFS